MQPHVRALVAILVTLSWLAPRAARAEVKQPNGTVVPSPAIGCFSGQPGGLAAVLACACDKPGVCNIGKSCPGGSTSCDPGTNATCETTLWHNVNDDPCIPSNLGGLDPVKAAATKPETFRPVCGLTFTLLAREAKFKNAFGWYNVTSNGKAPDANDLHTLIDCNTPLQQATPFNVLADPAYKGGDIGFFLATPESHSNAGECAGGDCCATVSRASNGEGHIYYSQPTFNPDNNGPGAFIHLLTIKSRVTANKFYFAWEDTFGGSTNEFTDFVTSVEGISCSGAGLRCDTGQPGVCNLGVTKCQGSDSAPACVATNQPSAETCDGQDNDCNGLVDDNATCPTNEVCHQGRCVPHCKATKEFACRVGTVCDEAQGICVDKDCVGVLCKAGEICRGGACGNGCGGNVVCPRGQVCQAGACVDLCAGKTCGANEICKLGVCIQGCAQCGGLTCSGGLSCDQQSGDCLDTSCSGGCGPGTVCDQGQCKGPCDGVVCPGSASCVDGQCIAQGAGPGPSPGADGGGPAPGSDGGATGSDSGGTNSGFNSDDGGCSCNTTSPSSGSGILLLLLALVLVGRQRRRSRIERA
ncbi:MAG: DUF4114 domain-containing protein [Myxococcales bacterium]|nr:DUF4114 domain-containing protein [Myxococcales bacterium]